MISDCLECQAYDEKSAFRGGNLIRQLGRASLIRLGFGVAIAVIGIILQYPVAALAILLVLGMPFGLRYLDQTRQKRRARQQELIDYAASIAKQRQHERLAAGTPPSIPLPQTLPNSAAIIPPQSPPPSPQAQLQQYDFEFSDTPETIKTTPEDHLEWQGSTQAPPPSVRPRSNPAKKHYFDTDTAIDFAAPDAVKNFTLPDPSEDSQRIVGMRDGYTIIERLDAEPAHRFALMQDQQCLFQGDYAATRAALNAALTER